MLIEIGEVESIFRYPVKSMAGERMQAADLGWHGIDGDRRMALRRVSDGGDFPFLTAGKLPELILFTPCTESGTNGAAPTHVRTPEGRVLPMFGDELADEISRRSGVAVQMMKMRSGVFDEGSVSVIASDTVDEICRLSGVNSDVRRFRPNILLRATRQAPFHEDEWVGGVLTFGDGDDAPAVSVTLRDIRCAMLNIDPDTAKLATEMMKTVVRVHENTAGVYGTVTRIGRVEVGQRVRLTTLAK